MHVENIGDNLVKEAWQKNEYVKPVYETVLSKGKEHIKWADCEKKLEGGGYLTLRINGSFLSGKPAFPINIAAAIALKASTKSIYPIWYVNENNRWIVTDDEGIDL